MPLVFDSVPVARPFGTAGTVLVAGAAWLPGHVRAAVDAEHVDVQVREPRSTDRSLVVSMMWTARGASFSALDADLRLEPLRADLSRLGLSGTYEPQHEVTSRRDALRHQSLVEACVRSFLTGAAVTLAGWGEPR